MMSGKEEPTQDRHGRRAELTVHIFDPPMCCPTGLCGPVVDPSLLDIYETLLKIKTDYNGRSVVERHVLGQQPAQFMQEPEVVRRLRTHGVSVLPITVVDGIVVKERSYPSYAELRQWIESGPQVLREGS